MKLPNAEDAIISPEKLKGYLLSRSHLIGRWKSRFFRSMGFSEAEVAVLKDALINVAKNGEVKSVIPTDFGIKYVVEGWITGPSERQALVQTVWIIESGEQHPRLITAYPD
jgi:hypothetical protein